ncbi:uncharacterized protein LOC107664299 [Sinocyclocheilus anshuiensis]|uniref:uncharacterized protein LOC107664299 n=1 Tax=Sinocyclocheilus anshuiensis TaxID=1608454 RepID=UPI0007B7DDA7|nr:PREDICTED: uncharacterized protein LOC107664299 [Sinocyclocheilus anshuiensis]
MNLTPPSLEASLNEDNAVAPTNNSTPEPSVQSHSFTKSPPECPPENLQVSEVSIPSKLIVQNDNLRKQLKKVKRQNQELMKKLKEEHSKAERYRKKCERKIEQKPARTISEKFHSRAAKKLSSERKKRVEAFLQLDENSILLPGKKDTIGRKDKKQRRILTSTLQDLHKVFNDKSDKLHRMSYRQFTRYKPFYITQPKSCDRNKK